MTPFAALRAKLVPYARHFRVDDDSAELYSLHEHAPGATTLFGYASQRRRKVWFGFYPLNFPELRELPAALSPRLSGKWVLKFDAITAAELAAIDEMLAAAWRRIAIKRALAPRLSYIRKLDLKATHATIARLIAKRPELVLTLQKSAVTLALPATIAVPAPLAARQRRPGVLKLTTLTPDQYEALVALVR